MNLRLALDAQNSENRKRGADRFGDVVRPEMRIMPLGHAGIAVAELNRFLSLNIGFWG
jgi:hypothetical protein